MNILLIDRALPSSVYSGKTVRLKNIYGRLARENHIFYLRIAQKGDEKESQELENWVNQTFKACLRMPKLPNVRFINRFLTTLRLRPWYDLFSKYPQEVEKIKEDLLVLVKDKQIDLVITFDQEVAQYGILLLERCPWIQDLGDSYGLQLNRRIKQADSLGGKLSYQFRKLRETSFEREMIQKSTATIFVAEDDASIFPGVLRNKIKVIPNGVDSDYFDSTRVAAYKADNPYVVFTGHMSFLPNQDAACYFAESIFPLIREQFSNFEFWVVGAEPGEKVKALKQIRGVTVTGQVEDLRPYLAGALAFVCPMRMGSGIKNKVLEAMSMGLPIIASTLAVAGIQNFENTENTIADSPSKFSEKLCAVIKDPEKFRALRKDNRQFVIKNYSWLKTLAAYEELFNKKSDSKPLVASK